MEFVKILIIIFASLVFLFFVFLFIIYDKVFLMTKRKKHKALVFDVPFGAPEHKDIILSNTKLLEGKKHNDVYVKSFDGKILHGYYYHVSDNSPLEIAFHGYKGQAFRDFSGGALMALEKGFNLLLVEERAHGASSGITITFGIKERRDVLTWINFAKTSIRFNNKILLTGISMGAATVLMASNLDLPDKVKGIIADCPYSSPKEIILKVMKEMHLSTKIMSPFVSLSALLFGHFRINEMTAVRAVKDAKIPILLIHGEDDSFVPIEMSEEIARANSNVQFERFSGADHGLSYLVDTNRYKIIVNDFITNILIEEDK